MKIELDLEEFNKIFSDVRNINLPLLSTEHDDEWLKEGQGYEGTCTHHYRFNDDLILSIDFISDSYGNDESTAKAIYFSVAKQVTKIVYEKI